MYATLARPLNIRNVLHYNEQKVTVGKADFLWAENFVKEKDALTFQDKLDRFDRLISLYERNAPKLTHFFLSFDPKDVLSNEQMTVLANRYMEGIGFGQQPYLVYRHLDSGHPHLHVVSTNVSADGTPIPIGLKQIFQYHEVTRHLEAEFSLVRRHRATPEEQETFKVKRAQRVTYGETSIKRAISNVLNTVVDHYNYTSLEELNAILKEYNVVADRGTEHSRLYQNRGLVYSALDERGQKVSIGIWASSFSLKPTLPYLENKFILNQSLRQSLPNHIETEIRIILSVHRPDWPGFVKSMAWEGINVVVQENKEGKGSSVFFVDHHNKSVFSGESIGSQYTLEALQKSCVQEQDLQQEETQRQRIRLRL
jgi:hypothetical protein